VSASVLDLSSLVPLDVYRLVQVVSATGRAVIVQEAPLTGGFGAEVAPRIHEEAFLRSTFPVLRVGAPDTPCPPGALQDHYLPSLDRLLDAARYSLRF
jgi:pyruvate/2-oxoglutarate/acetoin dehydrogenase E1 component